MKEQESAEDKKIRTLKQAIFGVSISNKDLSKPDSPKLKGYIDKLDGYLSEDGDTFLHATPFGDKNGCIIVTKNKIMVCYHGTKFEDYFSSDKSDKDRSRREMSNNLSTSLVKMGFGDKEVDVHEGYKNEYMLSRDSMSKIINEALQPPNDKKNIEFNGHSLGGAVANIAALDFVSSNEHIDVSRVSVNSFGSPKVFSREAKELCESTGLNKNITRVEQYLDPVVKFPPEKEYKHAGEEISLVGVATLHSTNTYRKIAEKKLAPKHIDTSLSGYRRLIESLNSAMIKLSKSIITQIDKIKKPKRKQSPRKEFNSQPSITKSL